MKRFCGLLAVVAMMGTLSGLTGCSDSDQNDSVEVSTTVANENVDEDRISESEARSRAKGAIKGKFDSIPAYNGICGIRHTFMSVELFGQFEAQFSASVKVYSNGDTSIDTFNYKIVESK